MVTHCESNAKEYTWPSICDRPTLPQQYLKVTISRLLQYRYSILSYKARTRIDVPDKMYVLAVDTVLAAAVQGITA